MAKMRPHQPHVATTISTSQHSTAPNDVNWGVRRVSILGNFFFGFFFTFLTFFTEDDAAAAHITRAASNLTYTNFVTPQRRLEEICR